MSGTYLADVGTRINPTGFNVEQVYFVRSCMKGEGSHLPPMVLCLVVISPVLTSGMLLPDVGWLTCHLQQVLASYWPTGSLCGVRCSYNAMFGTDKATDVRVRFALSSTDKHCASTRHCEHHQRDLHLAGST